MSYDTSTKVAAKFQAASWRNPPISIVVTIEQPRCRKPGDWQAAGVGPVKAGGVIISSIVGVTALSLSRFMQVRVEGYIESRFGKYQLNFIKCEEVATEYKNPVMTILSRAGVPKVRGEIMRNDIGEDFAQKIVDAPSHIKRLFPRIKAPGSEAILTACRKAVAGNEIFAALNAVGAPQKTINAAVAFDLETQSVYSLIERGLQFARADALAQHPAIQALQPFNRHDHARIAHAALVQVKEYCGLWGHTGLPLDDILSWLGLTYGLEQEICREALILGANKRGLHVDDGPNRHIFLKDHYEAECVIFRMVRALNKVRSKHYKTRIPKSARIMVGSLTEQTISFCLEQRGALAGLIKWKLAILTGGPGVGKSTLIAALNDHYEVLLVVAVAAKAALRAHEISGARHTTIFSILEMDGGEDRWLTCVSVLVIEEASMVGSIQMAQLFEAALHYGIQKIVLCGDPNQLAPINNGSPFVDLIKTGQVPVFRLATNHRTNPASFGIADFCEEILEGNAA